MKLNITLVISFMSTLLTLLGLTCNALPILANFAREYYSTDTISPPEPASTIDIYGKEFLSAEGKGFPSSLAYYAESTKMSPSSGFLILPNSVTSSTLPDSPSRQTVFLDIHGSVVRIDQPRRGDYLTRSATRSASWFRSLRKREEEEEPQSMPSKLVRLGGETKPSISPATYVHYNEIQTRSLRKRRAPLQTRENNEEEQQQEGLPVITVEENESKEDPALLEKEEEEQRAMNDCIRFEEKGLIPTGSCQQHSEVQDYADRFVKRDLVETIKASGGSKAASQDILSLNLLQDMQNKLKADLDQVQEALKLLQSKAEQQKADSKTKADTEKKGEEDDDEGEGKDDDDKEDEGEEGKAKDKKDKKDEKKEDDKKEGDKKEGDKKEEQKGKEV